MNSTKSVQPSALGSVVLKRYHLGTQETFSVLVCGTRPHTCLRVLCAGARSGWNHSGRNSALKIWPGWVLDGSVGMATQTRLCGVSTGGEGGGPDITTPFTTHCNHEDYLLIHQGPHRPVNTDPVPQHVHTSPKPRRDTGDIRTGKKVTHIPVPEHAADVLHSSGRYWAHHHTPVSYLHVWQFVSVPWLEWAHAEQETKELET